MERKRLFPSVAVKSIIVIIIIQKCEPPLNETDNHKRNMRRGKQVAPTLLEISAADN